MSLITWSPEYAVHDARIDLEHQGLFEAINRLHAAMLEGKGSGLLKNVLQDLVAYTCHHFAHEESVMAASHYPGLGPHLKAHEALRRKVQEFAARFGRGEGTMTIEFTLFLSAWIQDHILSTDRLFGDYLRKSQPGTKDGAPPRAS